MNDTNKQPGRGIPDGLAGLQAVIFDMDGTLTVPMLDFKRIREDLGLSGPVDIAVQIAEMPPAERRQAWERIERHEREAADKARLQPYALTLLDHLRRQGMRLGLITRNTRRSVDSLCRRFGLCFDSVLTREYPFIKPRPEPVLKMCREWKIPPDRVLVAGDYRHDIECGREAGAMTCFVRNDGAADFSEMADFTVDNLRELAEMLF